MKTTKGSWSRVKDHRAVRETLDRVFPDKKQKEDASQTAPQTQKANPFSHIKIP